MLNSVLLPVNIGYIEQLHQKLLTGQEHKSKVRPMPIDIAKRNNYICSWRQVLTFNECIAAIAD